MEDGVRTSRRQILRYGGIGALVAAGAAAGLAVADAVGGPTAPSANRRSAGIPLPGHRELEQATFESLVGTNFVLRAPGGSQKVSLVSVKPHATARPGTGECFSLFFTAPHDAAASGSYTLSHPALGKFGMFLSPVGLPSVGQRYEAVVNRV
jgi:hypothetical protein